MLIGPFGAGKSSLAKALVRLQPGKLHYELNRLVTSRARRPGEDDSEYEFVTPEEFEARKKDYLYLFPNRGVAWYNAMPKQSRLQAGTIRLHTVLPDHVAHLKAKLEGTVIVVAVLHPSIAEIKHRLIQRSGSNPNEHLELRLSHVEADFAEAKRRADIIFYNEDGIEESAARLAREIENYLKERNS